MGVPHVDVLPKTEKGHGQAVHQDSAVEVEAGSTKGRHRKETERKQPGPRELELEGVTILQGSGTKESRRKTPGLRGIHTQKVETRGSPLHWSQNQRKRRQPIL